MRRSLVLRWLGQAVVRYTLALVATMLMLVLRHALDPGLGAHVPYLLVFPAVVFSAWYCGLWPAILTSVIAFLGEQYWFIPPIHSFAIVGAAGWTDTVVYFVVSAVVIAFAEKSRRTLARASSADRTDLIDKTRFKRDLRLVVLLPSRRAIEASCHRPILIQRVRVEQEHFVVILKRNSKVVGTCVA